MHLRLLASILCLFAPLLAHGVTITGFSPPFGPPGTVVTVTGSGFTGATTVEFNTNTPTLVDFTSVSDAELLIVVPPNAISGSLAVYAGAASASTSSNFIAAPVITSFNPPSGASPTMVYIFGENFVSTNTHVLFSGVATPVSPTYVAATEIEATVPVGATDGPLTVYTQAGTNTTTSNFLASTLPSITSVSPNFATNGQGINIFGGNFFNTVTVKFGSITANSPTIISTTEIAVNVPTGASSPDITVTTPDGSVTYTNFITGSGPIVYGFSPSYGGIGTSVALYGTDLQAVTDVTFNGVRERVTGYGGTNLNVSLTNNPGTGRIRVTLGASSFTTSTNFTNSSAPIVSDFYPTLGPPGSTVTIDGINFVSGTAVKFGSIPAAASVVAGTQISATVPTAGVGNYPLTLTSTGGSYTTGSNFTVTGTGPIITSLSQSNGVRGATLTLNGANFANLGSSAVKFNGAVGTFATPTSTTELTVTVPAGATTGYITVTNAGGAGCASPSLFYLQPWISSLSASGVAVNGSLVISGRNFSGLTSVLINGLSYAFSNTASQIFVSIPSNATPGRLEITTPGGSYISTNVFGILPKIYSFSPTIGPAGTVVTINGTSLSDVTDVMFGNVGTTDFTAGTDEIQVVVPVNAVSGPITVVSPYGDGVSSNSFTATKASFAQLTKTVSPVIATPGTPLTYTLFVSNQGPSIITSTLVADDLPTNTVFASASTTNGAWSYTNGAVNWNIGILTNGNTATMTIVVDGAENSVITNTAELSFAESDLQPIAYVASATTYIITDSDRTLSVARTSSFDTLVMWPLSAVHFLLETSTNLTTWSYPTNSVFVTNGVNAFTNTFASPEIFFRLRSP